MLRGVAIVDVLVALIAIVQHVTNVARDCASAEIAAMTGLNGGGGFVNETTVTREINGLD